MTDRVNTGYGHCPVCGQQVIGGQFICGHTPPTVEVTDRVIELKPCPMCGSEASPNGVIHRSHSPDAHWKDGTECLEAFYCNCLRCGLSNGSHIAGGYQTREEAIEKWNTRAAEARLENAADTIIELEAKITQKDQIIGLRDTRIKELSPEYLLTCAQVSNHDFEKRIAELEAMVFDHDKRHAETVARLEEQIGLEKQARTEQRKVLEMAEAALNGLVDYEQPLGHNSSTVAERWNAAERVLAAIDALQKPEVPK